MTTRHPPFRPPAPESGQRPNAGTLWPASQLVWFSRRWHSVAVPPYLKERQSTQAADMLGRPLYHHHPDQWRHIPDSAAPQGKDDGHPPVQTGVIPGGYSGRAALRREQCNGKPQHIAVCNLWCLWHHSLCYASL